MSSRAARFAPLVFTATLVLSVLALVVVVLNGGSIGSANATGSAILAISFSSVGAVIAIRRPGNSVGWIFLLGGFCNSLNAFSLEYASYALLTQPGRWPFGPFFAWLSTWIFAPGFVASFPLALLLFPTGRPPSPRWRPLLWLISVGLILAVIPMAVASWSPRGPALIIGNIWESGAVGGLAVMLQRAGVVTIIACILASVVSIGVRFRNAAGEERQQLKWIVYAGVLTFVVTITASPAAIFELPGFAADLASILATLALPSIPVAAGIAILKHRLYDIDVVINRTLVYAVLTVSLILIYVGCVVTLQYVFRLVSGEGSQLVIVASTLAIAALFNPLRRRIQNVVDRCLYRRKYDATRVLEGFSARLRDETNLDDLNENLASAVLETVRPEYVSLWLREPREPR